jgi:hypothetical protein
LASSSTAKSGIFHYRLFPPFDEWEGYPVIMCPSPQKDRDPKTPATASTAKGFLVAHHDASGWRETWSRPIRIV